MTNIIISFLKDEYGGGGGKVRNTSSDQQSDKNVDMDPAMQSLISGAFNIGGNGNIPEAPGFDDMREAPTEGGPPPTQRPQMSTQRNAPLSAGGRLQGGGK